MNPHHIFHRYYLLHILLLVGWMASVGCSKNEEVTVRNVQIKGGTTTPIIITNPPKPLLLLHLNHVAGNSPLEFDKRYTNEWGEQFTVDVFRYYLSNVVLIYDSAKRVALPETYFLVDQGRDASRTLQLPYIPEG
ncbi:MAG: MbnP family protein, partial [Bacteroidota bacterium]